MPTSSYVVEPASHRPLYLQLADDLRRQIDDGTLKAGDQVMPEVELAHRHKLARGTVRQALQLLVNQGLLERTRRKGTFVAGGGRATATALISIVVPFLRDALTAGIIRGAESILRRKGYSLLFGHSDGTLDIEAEHVRRLQRDQASGLILFPVAASTEADRLAEIMRPGFPIVVVDRVIPGLAASTVLVDNYGGAYQAVEHLIAAGHRRIGCITHAGSISSVDDRMLGYERALQAAGLASLPTAVLPFREPLSDGEPPPYHDFEMLAVDHLLNAPEPPSAFFCINDFIALAVMRHVICRGWRIPDQLALVGFDDIPLAPFMPVPLTTVAQPRFEIGSQAALLLLDQISGKESAKHTVVLPTALVVRASTVIN